MRQWFNKNLNTVIVGSFLIPILLVAFVSISHVTTLYSLSNPFSWAIYLSVAVEIAALAALAGISAKFGKFIYIPFGIVTFIQFVGNFFYSYSHINVNSQDFKDWVDMISSLLEPLGVDPTDATSHRRILAFITGGLIPFISLTFAHMLIIYSTKLQSAETEEQPNPIELTEEQLHELSKKVGQQEAERVKTEFVPTEEDLQNIESVLKSFEKKDEVNPSDVVSSEPLEEIQEEPIINEPSVDGVDNEITTTETTETTYYVDDEEIKIPEETDEGQPKIRRLSYSKK
jgi:hypothetical protein